MQKLFKSENIQYKVYPVTRYTELLARIEESRVYEQVKLFLFVNCGGIIDLTQSDIMQRNDAQIFLFDINKPINHKNLESEYVSKVIVRSKSSMMGTVSSIVVPPRWRYRSAKRSTSTYWTPMRLKRRKRRRLTTRPSEETRRSSETSSESIENLSRIRWRVTTTAIFSDTQVLSQPTAWCATSRRPTTTTFGTPSWE